MYEQSSQSSRKVAVLLLCLSTCMVAIAQDKSKPADTPNDRTPSWAVDSLVNSIDRSYVGTNGNHQQPLVPSISIDFKAYEKDRRELPIGVFDSGIGGLTVLEAILSCDLHNNRTGAPGSDGVPDFDNERFVYLGDQANMPYGNYPEKGKEDFLRELIIKDSLFLLGNRSWANRGAMNPDFTKPPVKAIVIACNTATAFGLEDLRRSLARLQLPVLTIGVVEAGATAVIEEVKQTKSPGAVAVLATMGTCNSGAYPRAISQTAGRQGLRVPTVVQQGSLGLAGAIEGDPAFVVANRTDASPGITYRGPSVERAEATIDLNLTDRYSFDMQGVLGTTQDPRTWRLNSIENYIRYDVTTLVETYRRNATSSESNQSPSEVKPIEYVMLGCTHFPFESVKIVSAFERLRNYCDREGNAPYRDLIAERVQMINPAELTAKDLFRQLFLQRQMHPSQKNSQSNRIFVSVPNTETVGPEHLEDGWFKYDFKYGRRAGDFQFEQTKVVPLTSDVLPTSSKNLLLSYAPKVSAILEIVRPAD